MRKMKGTLQPTGRSGGLVAGPSLGANKINSLCSIHLRRYPSVTRVPDRSTPLKVGVVGHVTGNRRVIAEDRILDRRLPRLHRLEEIPQMIVEGVVIGRE